MTLGYPYSQFFPEHFVRSEPGKGRRGMALISSPLGCPSTLRCWLPILSWGRCSCELARVLPCRGTQQKFRIASWRAKGEKTSKEVAMGGKRRTLGWVGAGPGGQDCWAAAAAAGESGTGSVHCLESARLTAQGISCSNSRITAQDWQAGVFHF